MMSRLLSDTAYKMEINEIILVGLSYIRLMIRRSGSTLHRVHLYATWLHYLWFFASIFDAFILYDGLSNYIY